MEREVEKLELPSDIPPGPSYITEKKASGQRKPQGKRKKSATNGQANVPSKETSNRPIKVIVQKPSTN